MSKDGKKCDTMCQKVCGKGSAILVYKSGDKLFGGFMDEDYADHLGYFYSKNAFLFSVSQGKKFE